MSPTKSDKLSTPGKSKRTKERSPNKSKTPKKRRKKSKTPKKGIGQVRSKKALVSKQTINELVTDPKSSQDALSM